MIKIDLKKLVQIIIENQESQKNNYYISVNSAGDFYFAVDGEPLGDDILIFNFTHWDIDLKTSSFEDIREWLTDYLFDMARDSQLNLQII